MSKKKIAVLIVSLLAVTGVVGFLMLRNGQTSDKDVKSAATVETLISEQVGMTVQRDASLEQKPVTKEGEAQRQLWQLAQPAGSQEQFAIDANYEQGASLKKLTGYTKQPLRDSVVTNINLQLPRQYPQYKELTQRNVTVSGIEANETIFEYDSKGVKVKQRLMLFFKNSDTAVYIRAQAKADEYDAINSKYFEPLFSSVKFE